MKNKISSAVLLFFIFTGQLYAQEFCKELFVRSARQADSNKIIAAHNTTLEIIECLKKTNGEFYKNSDAGKIFYIGKFSDKKAIVQLNTKKYAVVNDQLRIVQELPYERILSFVDDRAIVVTKERFCGIIDRTGKEIVPAAYKYMGNIIEGMVWVHLAYNDRGYFNLQGQLQPFRFNGLLGNFNKGLAVVTHNQKKGIINKKGEWVIPAEYDEIGTESEEIFIVKKGSRFGAFDRNGKLLIPVQYEDASFHFKQGLWAVKKNGSYGYIDKTGKTVIPFVYQSATSFYADRAKVQKNYRYGFINVKGEVVVPLEYDQIESLWNEFFKTGLETASKNGKHGLIDKMGKPITGFIYDYIVLKGGIWVVSNNGLKGATDLSGRKIIETAYKDIGEMNEGFCLVINNNNKMDYFDIKGKPLTNFRYDIAPLAAMPDPFRNGRGIISVYDTENRIPLYGYIDATGKEVIPARFTYVRSFSDGFADVNAGSNYSFTIDMSGNCVDRCENDNQ